MNEPGDKGFAESHDEQLSALYRAASRAEPPAPLDEAVLAEARHALRRPVRRWWLPLSSAAVILLGVGVGLQLMREPVYQTDLPVPLEESAEEALELKPQSAPLPARKKQEKPPAPSLQQAPAPAMAPLFDKAVPESKGRERLLERARPEGGLAEPSPATILPTPEDWLARIERYWAAGERQRAVDELAALQQAYPDFVVPAELRERLRSAR